MTRPASGIASRWLVHLTAMVAATAMGLTATACSSNHNATPFEPGATDESAGDPSALSATAAGVTVSVPSRSLSNSETTLAITSRPAPDDVASLLGDAVSALGDGVEVSLSGGTLVGPAQVTFPIPADFDATRYVAGVVWDAGDGTWEVLDSTWAPGDTTVTARTSHFSIGWPIKIDVSKIGTGIVDWLKNLATGRSGVANPTCGDENAPRAGGVEVISDTGDLVKWCYGRDNGRDVVKVTNNWRAGTQLTFPKTWTVIEYQGSGVNLQALGDWMDSVSRETSTTRSRLIGPGQTIVLDPGVIPEGSSTTAVAEISTVSWMWSIALTAVDMYLVTIGKLARIDKNTTAESLVDSIAFAKCFTDHYGADANVLDPVAAESTFDVVAAAARFGIDCGKDIIQSSLQSRGGILGKIGAQLVGVLAAAIGIVYGLVNALMAGIRALIDEIGVLFDGTEIGGYGYDIVLTARAAPTQSPATPNLDMLRSATVPSVCGFPAGRLIDGQLSTVATSDFPEGYVSLTNTFATGDLDGDGSPEVAVVFDCSGGGVSWPQELHVFRADLTPIGFVDLTDAYPDLLVWRAGYQWLSYSDGKFHAQVILEESAVDPIAERGMTIAMAGGRLVVDGEGPPAQCPEWGELARRGDGVPTPCESIAGVQRVLASLGYAVEDDGQFGPATEAAVMAFQADYGLPVTGEIDATTWYTLLPPD
ncbi:MAG: peptidoglycan-binding domain-containing protein [Ilumatobacteraceae bacterium]